MTMECGCAVLTDSSVSRFTFATQVGLRTALYAESMDLPDLKTAAGRIRHAIETSGKTLEAIASEIGCTHAALSQWQTGATDAQNIKAGLLQAFAESTGTDVRWLLTGKGPQVSRYIRTGEMERLATAIKAMERWSPMQIETVVRMVEAAAKDHPVPEH
jgi:transcriptional regulator with XRE-family HTH domain